MRNLYTYPQEIWDEKKCEKVAKRRTKDSYGTVHSRPGLVAPSGSAYPVMGEIVRYNGGTIIDGEHYQSVLIPLPKIPDSFEFYHVCSWGTYLRKK